MQRQRNKNRHLHPVRITIAVVVLVFLFGWIVYATGNHPKKAAQAQATSLARKYAHLTHVNDFYTYNREKTYYTVAGTNQKNQKEYVIVAQKGGRIRVLKQSAGISKNAALSQTWQQRKPKKVLKIALGVFNDKPVWEVTYINQKGNLCYDLLNYKNGHVIQKISNL